MNLKMNKISTKDSYEASYYLLYGAKFVKLRLQPLSEKRKRRRGYSKQWLIYLENVPRWAIEAWRSGFAYASVNEFASKRKRLKRMMRDYI